MFGADVLVHAKNRWLIGWYNFICVIIAILYILLNRIHPVAITSVGDIFEFPNPPIIIALKFHKIAFRTELVEMESKRFATKAVQRKGIAYVEFCIFHELYIIVK